MMIPPNSSISQGISVWYYGELMHGFCFTQYIHLTDSEDVNWLSFKF
jgi:hypothetical protein